MVSRCHGLLRSVSTCPVHRSTTGLPSRVTATAAPVSPKVEKFFTRASRTASKRRSQVPSIFGDADMCSPLTSSDWINQRPRHEHRVEYAEFLLELERLAVERDLIDVLAGVEHARLVIVQRLQDGVVGLDTDQRGRKGRGLDGLDADVAEQMPQGARRVDAGAP